MAGSSTTGQSGGTPRIGVCSWSLRPQSAADLARQITETGVRWVQLALDPIRDGRWNLTETRRVLADVGIGVLSGMMATKGEDYSTLQTIRATGGVRRDATWPDNLSAARANAALAKDLGLTLVTLHAGFLPHDAKDPERSVLIDRLRQLADVFGASGVRLGFETGQESATTLLEVLAELDHTNVGVNFDPANMILYGMGEPVSALRMLAHAVIQLHVKDAVPTRAPGEWGQEVPAGAGSVHWGEFFGVYRSAGLSCDLVIEREAGPDRVSDIRTARALIERHFGNAATSSKGGVA